MRLTPEEGRRTDPDAGYAPLRTGDRLAEGALGGDIGRRVAPVAASGTGAGDARRGRGPRAGAAASGRGP